MGIVLIAGCSADLTADSSAPSSASPLTAQVAPMVKSTPVRVQIPAIGVDSNLMDLRLQADGTLQVPPAGSPAGWYDGARPWPVGCWPWAHSADGGLAAPSRRLATARYHQAERVRRGSLGSPSLGPGSGGVVRGEHVGGEVGVDDSAGHVAEPQVVVARIAA
jgi:hypothetical protein